MNAIRPLNAFAQAVTPLPDPLAARRAVVARRLAELQGTWLRSDGVELRILPNVTPRSASRWPPPCWPTPACAS